MGTKDLITANNEKRKQLSKINKQYYDDMLVYIRLQLLASEQKSEEILMDMLDHLLEGQQEGKNAYQIFGNDPEEYAKEIVSELPREDKKSFALFISEMLLTLAAWFLIARGAIYLLFSFFKDVNTTVYVSSMLIIGVAVILLATVGILFIFNLIKKSLFLEERFQKEVSNSNTIKSAIFGGGSFLFIMAIVKLAPQKGPTIELTWSVSLLTGIILLTIISMLKKITKAKLDQ